MSSPENDTDDERDAAEFGALLQYHRGRVGLTQSQLADFSTISVRAIRDLESGRARHPRRDTVRLLADALRLSDERRAVLEAAAERGPKGAASASGRRAAGGRVPSPAPPPAAAGPLLGRADEKRALYELLAAGRDRLVAVAGLGGVGKTRLTLAVAQELNARLGMPVLWLAGERRERRRVPSVHPVQVAEPWLRELMANPDDTMDDLAAFIGDRAFLLVLDGQRPQSAHAGGTAARTAAARGHTLSPDAQLALLGRCPRLRIVSTLRTTEASASTLLGQHTLRLSPLVNVEAAGLAADGCDYDGDDGDPSDPAAQLVLWHMQRLRPHWRATQRELDAITALCRSLDGIPLALESAAAWSLVVSPPRLAALAAREPFTVTAPPAERARTRSDPVRAALADAVAAATPQVRRVLSLVSGWERPWSLDQVAARSGQRFDEVSAAVHALLVHGLIRPVRSETDDAPGTFAVLNLVRHLVRVPAQPSVSAYLRPVGRPARTGALTRR